MEKCDVLVVGAGPGGLAAAKGAREAGARKVVIVERDDCAGGILNQCIHDGFGLVRYKKQLTGPEYAVRAIKEAEEAGVEICTGHQVTGITDELVVTAASREGLKKFKAGAIVLATGCRERTRGAISIPGSRPAGVYTAGVAQNLINIHNIMPGKEIVILGSGDVGMIMARRLTLEGAKVKAVVEILPEPAGLARNVTQCLYDYQIPIYCSHTVSNIIGKKRVSAVEISELDKDRKPVKGTEQIIECDTLILSVGLIPENEIAEQAGVKLDERTNGVITDQYLMTNIPGIFSCGNSRSIMDLADFVSEQGEAAGKNAAAFISGKEMTAWNSAVSAAMVKGFPEKNTITCTLCPNGCQVKYDETAQTYSGNKCPRGIAYAKQEKTSPMRILTTTVKAAGAKRSLIPVRTDKPVRKTEIKTLLNQIRESELSSSVHCGDTVLSLTDSGETIHVIATGSSKQ